MMDDQGTSGPNHIRVQHSLLRPDTDDILNNSISQNPTVLIENNSLLGGGAGNHDAQTHMKESPIRTIQQRSIDRDAIFSSGPKDNFRSTSQQSTGNQVADSLAGDEVLVSASSGKQKQIRNPQPQSQKLVTKFD